MQMVATPARKSTEVTRTQVFPVGNLFPFVLVTILFFIWGMSTNLTDILVQQFKKSFELYSGRSLRLLRLPHEDFRPATLCCARKRVRLTFTLR